MLSQMKKYRQTDMASSDDVKEPSSSPVISESAQTVPAKKTVKALPTEESLFEFDEVAFDDIDTTEKPELTPEEAEYAETLSEKFGISDNVGIGFLDDSPAEEVVSRMPVISDEPEADIFEDDEPEVFENDEPEVFENDELEVFENDEPAAFEDDDPELAVISELSDDGAEEPAQVVFGMQAEPEVQEETVSVQEETGSAPVDGVQMTFLDAPDEYDDDEAEQIVLGQYAEEQGEYEEEYDNIDEDEEPYEDDAEDEYFSVNPSEISDDMFARPVFVGESVQSAEEEQAEYEELSETQDAEAEELGKEQEAEELPLTPLELAAMEQAQELADIAEEQPAAENKIERYDIWDDEDRAEIEKKKAFSDFCNSLPSPVLKAESNGASVQRASRESSGYKYESSERMPIFPDGVAGGRDTDSYKSREAAFCAERENKRSALLLDRLRVSSRKLVCSAVIMIMVLLIENLGFFFGGTPDSLLKTEHYMTFGITVAVLLTVGAAMVFDVIKDGIKCVLDGVFIPETMATFVIIPSLIYHYIIAFYAPLSKHSMLFGTGCAAVMLLSGLYRYVLLKREQVTFSVTASYGDYLTEVKVKDFKNSPEGRAFGSYVDDDASLYRFNKVSRIDASYSDSTVRDDCFGLTRIISLCIICAAVVAGVVFGFIHKDALYGVISAISLVTYACPASVFIALSLPRLRAAAASAELGGAIVNLDDEDDELDSSVIMIDEQELFPPEKLVACDFYFQYSPIMEIHISRTRALFKKLGGSLAAMFNGVEGVAMNFENITVTEIAANGISAKIDGVPICVGTEGYMMQLGLKIKCGDKLLPRTGRYIYVVDNGEFAARAVLIFKADEEIVQKISELRNTETVFSFKTCNPCIDEELLYHATGIEPELLRLVKYKTADPVSQLESDREGGLVSGSGALGLLSAFLERKRQNKLLYQASRFALAACALGAVVSVITSAVGVNFGFSSLTVLATHGVMSLAALLMSRSGAINTKSKIKKR